MKKEIKNSLSILHSLWTLVFLFFIIAAVAASCGGGGGGGGDGGGGDDGGSTPPAPSPPQAHISYTDGTNGDLKYATNASGAWVAATVDSTGDVGGYTSLKVR